MCGIFGFSVPNMPQTQRAIIASMLVNGNIERGNHSWGLVGFKGEDIEISRALGSMANGGAYEASKYVTCFAHTRFATHGAKTIQNTHPFEVGSLVAAHNGIIYNTEMLNRKYDRNNEVDSIHLVQHLAEDRPFNDAEGYGSLVWTDKKDPNKIYLSRMLDGELAIYGIGTPENCKGVVFSSDEDHLIAALLMAGLDKVFKFATPEGDVLFVENGRLFQDQRKRRLELSEGIKVNLKWEDYKKASNYSYIPIDNNIKDEDYKRPSRNDDDSYKLWPDKDPWAAFEEDEEKEWKDYLDEKALAKG